MTIQPTNRGQPANRLQQAIADILAGKIDREAFYTVLLEEELVVPVRGEVVRSEGKAAVHVLCAYDPDGKVCAGVFSSEEAMRLWLAGGNDFIRAIGWRVFQMLAGMDIERVYVDWGSPNWLMLGRHEINSLARRQPAIFAAAVQELPTIEEISVGKPDQAWLDEALRDVLRKLVEQEPRIAFAYLPTIHYKRRQQAKSAVVLVLVPRQGLADEEIEDAVDTIGERAQDFVPAGQPLDVMTLPPGHELLSVVMRGGCVLTVNDQAYHQHLLDAYSRFWTMSA